MHHQFRSAVLLLLLLFILFYTSYISFDAAAVTAFLLLHQPILSKVLHHHRHYQLQKDHVLQSSSSFISSYYYYKDDISKRYHSTVAERAPGGITIMSRFGSKNDNDHNTNYDSILSQSSSLIKDNNTDNNNSTLSTTDDFINLYNIKRIFCLSDLHTDNIDNMKCLEDNIEQSDLSYNDLMIIAGDICHDIETFKHTLQMIRQKCQILFVSGNHEAWLDNVNDTLYNSIDKLNRMDDICREYQCYVDPIYVHGIYPLWIIPLKCWYDGTLSFNESLCNGFQYWPWIDFYRCKWPYPLYDNNSNNARIPNGLVQYYLNINQQYIQRIQEQLVIQQNQYQQNQNEELTINNNNNNPCSIISVSHFLPNQQCLPDWKDLNVNEFNSIEWLNHGAGTMSAKFAKVAGTILLDNQIRNIISQNNTINNRQIHIFGHSHRPKDFIYNNIRYIHHPLGKPRERQLYMISPNVTWKLIWDINIGEVIESPYPIIRYWEEHGNGLQTFSKIK